MTRPIAIIGPSGVGKTTLVRRLVQEFPEMYDEVISHTSRDIREGEVNGVDYHFTDRAQLEHMIDEGMMIEHAEYGGNLYSLSKVEFDVEPKQPVVVVERHGFDQLVEYFGRDNVVGILVFPPSMKELERRLESRPERIATAREEMAVDRNFDLIVVNTHILHTIIAIRNGLFRIAKFRGWNVGNY
jgi:guanylate kinase